MKRSTTFAGIAFALWAGTACALDLGEADSFLVDLDGDRLSEMVTIQYKTVSLVVDSDGTSQRIAFDSATEGLKEPCRKPVELKVVPLECRVGDEQLDGCKQSAAAKGLLLNAAGCGSVYLYWNSDALRVDWRRL